MRGSSQTAGQIANTIWPTLCALPQLSRKFEEKNQMTGNLMTIDPIASAIWLAVSALHVAFRAIFGKRMNFLMWKSNVLTSDTVFKIIKVRWAKNLIFKG